MSLRSSLYRLRKPTDRTTLHLSHHRLAHPCFIFYPVFVRSTKYSLKCSLARFSPFLFLSVTCLLTFVLYFALVFSSCCYFWIILSTFFLPHPCDLFRCLSSPVISQLISLSPAELFILLYHWCWVFLFFASFLPPFTRPVTQVITSYFRTSSTL